jgi:uncharacterized protein (TIGR00251 family)
VSRAPRGGRIDAAALELRDADGGCRLRARVQPAARQDTITGVHGGALRMTVAAPPERGKANEAVARLLASALNIATSRVAVVSGFTSKDKVVQVAGLTAAEVGLRLSSGPRISTGAAR